MTWLARMRAWFTRWFVSDPTPPAPLSIPIAVHSSAPETIAREIESRVTATLTRVRNVESKGLGAEDVITPGPLPIMRADVLPGERVDVRDARLARLRRVADVQSGTLTYYSGCRRCTAPWDSVERHVTRYGGSALVPLREEWSEDVAASPHMRYSHGSIPSPNDRDSEQPTMVVASSGLFVLCEPCWAECTPEERLPYYRAQWEEWATIMHAGTATVAQVEELHARWPLIRVAVLVGK